MQQSANGKAVTREDPVNAKTSDTHTETLRTYVRTMMLESNKARDSPRDPEVTTVIVPSIMICSQYAIKTKKKDRPD